MRILAGLIFVVTACSGPKAKPENPLVPEGSGGMPENCCCKSNPLTAEDGKPVYQTGNRMECSSQKRGDCVPEVQCEAAAVPPAEPAPSP